MRIGKKIINSVSKPYIIAEISANHGKSLSKCYKLIDLIASSGADAIKIQTYKPDSITIDSKRKEFLIKNLKNPWDNKYLFELYKKSFLPYGLIKKIKDHCKKKNIFFFSSVFDIEGINFLEKLNIQAYKISSFEFNHIPLIEKLLNTNKALIFSTGVSDYNEIKKINKLISKKTKNYAILHCVSSYPATISDHNFYMMNKMKNELKVIVGLSDHTTDSLTAITAVCNGAQIIEKHIKLDNDKNSSDSHFSLPVSKLPKFVNEIKLAWEATFKNRIKKFKLNKKYFKYKRSIYLVKSIKKGETFNETHLKIIRPNNGLEPTFYKNILKKKALKTLNAPRPLSKNDYQK